MAAAAWPALPLEPEQPAPGSVIAPPDGLTDQPWPRKPPHLPHRSQPAAAAAAASTAAAAAAAAAADTAAAAAAAGRHGQTAGLPEPTASGPPAELPAAAAAAAERAAAQNSAAVPPALPTSHIAGVPRPVPDLAQTAAQPPERPGRAAPPAQPLAGRHHTLAPSVAAVAAATRAQPPLHLGTPIAMRLAAAAPRLAAQASRGANAAACWGSGQLA